MVRLSVLFIVSAAAANASPLVDYSIQNINVPNGEICKPDEVISALRGQFIVAPVELAVRGLDDRLPPLALDDVGSWGLTRVGTDGQPKFHAGTDLIADEGEPVLAIMDGEAIATGNSGAIGNYAIVRGTVTFPPLKPCAIDFLYAHLSSVSVVAGDDLVAGQTVGTVGRTGNLSPGISTHLHIEFWVRPYLNGGSARQESTRDIMPLFTF